MRQVADLWAVFSIINVTWTLPIGAGRSLLSVAVGRPSYDLGAGPVEWSLKPERVPNRYECLYM